MRLGIVVVGIVLLVLGAVLLYVPLAPQANQDVPSNGTAVEVKVGGYSLTGNIPVAISWTAPTTVTIGGATCSGTCNANTTSISGATIQSGTSGSFTLNQPNGGSIELVAASVSGILSNTNSTVTFKLTTAISTVGTILVVLGIVLLIVGLVVRSRRAAPTPATATTTTSVSTPPPEPPATPPNP